jgi:hypothetical protein
MLAAEALQIGVPRSTRWQWLELQVSPLEALRVQVVCPRLKWKAYSSNGVLSMLTIRPRG